MKILREFKHRGFVVTLEEESLPPVALIGGGLSPVVKEVTVMSWTKNGGGRRDISKFVPQTKDLYAWQRSAETYIDAWIDQ